MNIDQIKEYMLIICVDGKNYGEVDYFDGEYIKIVKDVQGQYYWLLLSVVDYVDEYVYFKFLYEQVYQQMFSEDLYFEYWK